MILQLTRIIAVVCLLCVLVTNAIAGNGNGNNGNGNNGNGNNGNGNNGNGNNGNGNNGNGNNGNGNNGNGNNGNGNGNGGPAWYVRITGDDSNSGKNRGQAFRTLTQALSAAADNDTIYVGAGTYSEYSAVWNGNSKGNPNGTLTILGDIDGQYTGDKGMPVIQVTNNAWGLNIQNAKSVIFSNLAFQGGGSQDGLAVYTNQISQKCVFLECNFSQLRRGNQTANSNNCSFDSCVFNELEIAVHSNTNNSAEVTNCEFINCKYGVYGGDGNSITCTNSTFTCLPDANGNYITSYSVRTFRTGLSLSGITSTKDNYTVYATDMTSADFSSCQINQPRSWGIYGTGENLSASNIQVVGIDRTGNGVLLKDLQAKTPSLTNITLTNLYIGVGVQESEYKFGQLSITNCHLGIYVYAVSPSFSLDQTDKITFDDNHVAVYTVHNDGSPGTVDIRNVDLTNNDYGMISYRANVTLKNCSFNDNALGCYLYDVVSATVSKCDFSGNTARTDAIGHYGLLLRGTNLLVSDCAFEDNVNGLYVYNTTDQNPRLQDLTITNNSTYGLIVTGGKLELTAGNRILISNCRYGIRGSQTLAVLNGVVSPSGGEYPFLFTQGSLKISGSNITEGKIGVYSTDQDSLSISDMTIAGMVSHGIYIARSVAVDVSSVDVYSNADHGLYCYMLDMNSDLFSVKDSRFDSNRIGLRTVGVNIDPQKIGNLQLTNNNYGLYVERGNLTLDNSENLTVSGNLWGVLNYYAIADLSNLTLDNNQNGVYSYGGQIEADSLTINSTVSHGLAAIQSSAQITNLTARNSANGIYFNAQAVTGLSINVVGGLFENNSSCGIQLRTDPDNPVTATLTGAQINNCNYGIYNYQCQANIANISVQNPTAYGYYANNAQTEIERYSIFNGQNWGVVCVGGTADLSRLQVASKYGVNLQTTSTTLVNSVISGSTYGVYVSAPGGNVNVFQTTIANIGSYGVLLRDGTMTVRNTIVDSALYGIYDQTSNGLTHDHNLVNGGRQLFVNTSMDGTETKKKPIFVNAAGGDFHLAAGSPAINSGADLTGLIADDLDGNSRPSFREFEIGAYEFTDAAGSLRVLDWDEVAN
ncbi:MAG: right-handed parallel beta-helix repeat-containing protein [Planctomycetales bacterium]|nr:right-handed parallel beta-helix repeat-containing protein [Planctomycetales bacterium]